MNEEDELHIEVFGQSW